MRQHANMHLLGINTFFFITIWSHSGNLALTQYFNLIYSPYSNFFNFPIRSFMLLPHPTMNQGLHVAFGGYVSLLYSTFPAFYISFFILLTFWKDPSQFFVFFFFNPHPRICLVTLERMERGGREKKTSLWEGNIDYVLNGDRTCNLGCALTW